MRRPASVFDFGMASAAISFSDVVCSSAWTGPAAGAGVRKPKDEQAEESDEDMRVHDCFSFVDDLSLFAVPRRT